MKNLELTRSSRRMRVTQLGITVGLAMLFLVILLWGLRGITPAHADPGVLYVDGATGQDIVTCGTSGTPCRTISYTLNSRASGGDAIRVAQGVYTENLTIGISVTLEGGYEASGWTRSITQHETIIDGSSSGTVMLLFPGSDGSVLDGFTVRNGQTAGDGGGIYVVAVAQATIQNCIVISNSANESGGGISVRWPEVTNVIIRDTQVLSNVAGQYGGGIRVGNGAMATIVGTDIVTNTAGDGGGGISVDNGSTAIITGNHVLSNTTNGWASGGILITDYSTATILSNEIVSNTAPTGWGGAIRVHKQSYVTIANNTIKANSAQGAAGINFSSNCSATVDANAITNNIGDPGGINIWGGSRVTVTNNIISSNGQGVDMGDSTTQVWLINNTIVDNSIEGILTNDASTLLVRNNIIARNDVGIHNGYGAASITLDHNDIWGNSWLNYRNVVTGATDISADPLFVDATNGDYHLRNDSPCIDAGAGTNAPPVDFEGDSRPLDGDLDDIAIVDIGADEFKPYQIYLPLTLKNVGS